MNPPKHDTRHLCSKLCRRRIQLLSLLCLGVAYCVLSYTTLVFKVTSVNYETDADVSDKVRLHAMPHDPEDWIQSQGANHVRSDGTGKATVHLGIQQQTRLEEVNQLNPTNTNNNSTNAKLRFASGPIFYNIFVPSSNDPNYNSTHLKQIFQEQFHQRNLSDPHASVQYTLITNRQWKEQIDQLCGHDCTMREYMEVGDELHTLQAMWDYCQPYGKSNDQLVTYIHDKGSFHNTPSNEKARRVGTKAALECRHQMVEFPYKCNVCTSQFHIVPQYLGNSNMWTASCSYLRDLYPPSNYSKAMQEMYDKTIYDPILNTTTTKYACLQPFDTAYNHLGLGRYSLERWVWSHPNVKPCDVVQINMGQIPHESFDSTTHWEAELKHAPHKHPRQIGVQFGFMKSSFARLEGRLFEWDYIYGKVPPDSSWVWRWYRGFYKGNKSWLEKCAKSISK